MKKNYALVGLMMTMLAGFAQDPIFYNTNQSLVYLNPSFAGSNGFIRNQTAYRNQWPNLSGTYVTVSNSFDAYIKPIRGGIAVNYMNDDQNRGTVKNNVFSISYAQYFSLLENKLKIIPSVQFGYFSRHLDIQRLNFYDPIDPRNGIVWNNTTDTIVSTKGNFDFSSGLLVNYKDFYFGAAVLHINQPDEGFLGVSRLPYRINIHGSYNRKISETTLMNFSAQLFQQQNFSMLKLQVNSVFKNHIIVNTGLTSNSVVLLGLGYRHSLFTTSLGYDVSYSKLSGNRAGSWEFTTSFNLRNKENRKTLTNLEAW